LTLGLLTFNTLNAGTSAFTFTYGDLQGLEGIDPLDDSVENGRVPLVPLPQIPLLLGVGAVGMLSVRRRGAKD
jgi:hypothetical protein